jgi:hypothetical protein
LGRWLGHAGGKEGKRKKSSWAIKEERKGRKKAMLGWAAKKKREREKRKERVGRAQLEKEGEKELHSNAFEFEFKI